MKKISIYLMAICLSITFLPLQSSAANSNPVSGIVITNPPADPNAMMLRLNEIKGMDKSELTSSEKKSLRKEVRSLRHDLKKSGQYLYISLGAAIIIILLLVILL